jgi:hypothetical protein
VPIKIPKPLPIKEIIMERDDFGNEIGIVFNINGKRNAMGFGLGMDTYRLKKELRMFINWIKLQEEMADGDGN